MLYYTAGQALVFLAMLLAGAAAGLWYGLIRRAAKLMRAGPWLNALLDLFAAAGICAILTLALLAANYGEMRAYALAAAALGFAAERFTLGWLAGKLFVLMGGAARRAARALGRNHILNKIFK